MTHGQLFAGIGGFGLAAQWAGIKNVWANEIDPYCCKILRQNFEGLEVYEKDIRTFKPEYTDIITGGFPCQPFSHAGKRKGTDDNRYLWPEMLRVISEVRPRWVIGENVAGLLSMENGKTLDRILTDLEDQGYHTETFLIPASATGAWHRRERIWIIAHTESPGNKGKPRKRTEQDHKEIRGGIRGQSVNSSQDDSNTTAKGLQGYSRHESGNCKNHGFASNNISDGNYWQVKSGLGGMVDGLSNWLVEPEGIPRVTTKNQNRVNRLKGLGNAIVPQVAYEIFKAIIDYDQPAKRT